VEKSDQSHASGGKPFLVKKKGVMTGNWSRIAALLGALLTAAAANAMAPRASGGKGKFFPAQRRVVIISDVDDTIKNTGVTLGRTHIPNLPWILLDPVRPWRPVAGMPEFYAAMATKRKARFIYVSKGPPFSRNRLQRQLAHFGFPRGEIRLNERFPFAPSRYKFKAISPIIQSSPRDRYVLIGDSGEADPENYGALARRFPRQIDHIFIRSVSADWEGRYRVAFHGIPHSKWEVFAWPQDLMPGLH